MASKLFPYLDPNMDLTEAMKQVDQSQASQTKGVQDFGAAQDSNIKGIYDQLGGQLQQGTKSIQSIYGTAASNSGAAYDRAAIGGQAAASQTQGAIGTFASQLGMDPRALADVQGRLASQAQTFDLRNKASSAQRQGNLQQLSAGMASVAQLGEQAAQKAAAQGRSDLSRRIQTELQRVNTLAAQNKTGFTQARVQQMARATADAQTAVLKAQKEMASENRANARSAAADARAERSANRADARASKASGGLSWIDKFQMTNAAEQGRFERGQALIQDNPHDVVWNDYMAQNFGPKATAYIEDRLRDDPKRRPKLTPGMNKDLLETFVRRRQSIKEK